MRVLRVVLSPLIILVVAACGSHRPLRQRVLLPPALNLVPYRNIGLFEFSVENAKGTLHQFATRRFEEYVLAAQTGIKEQELKAADSSRTLTSGNHSSGSPSPFFG